MVGAVLGTAAPVLGTVSAALAGLTATIAGAALEAASTTGGGAMEAASTTGGGGPSPRDHPHVVHMGHRRIMVRTVLVMMESI